VPTGIATEPAPGEGGSGDVDILFQSGWHTFGIVQLQGPTLSWGSLNTDFGNSFGPYVDNDYSELNLGSNFGGGGAEVIGYDPNFGGSPFTTNYYGYQVAEDGIVYGNAMAYNPVSGDIIVAGTDNDYYGRYFTDSNGNRDSGGAVFAFNSATGAFDSTFGGGAGAVWANQPNMNPNPPQGDPNNPEGAITSVAVNDSNGLIYIAGYDLDSDASGGVPDAYGNFVGALEDNGAQYCAYFGTTNDGVGSELPDNLAVLSSGNVVADFVGDNYAELFSLSSTLTQTTSLWNDGPDSLVISGNGANYASAQMAVNVANGDIAVTFQDTYPGIIWINGTTGTQETLSDPYGNYKNPNCTSLAFNSDGSLTVAGVVGNGSEGDIVTLANYGFDNSVPSWLSIPANQDPFLTWNKSTETLNLYGTATVLADPSDTEYGDDPFVTVTGTSGDGLLNIAPATDRTVHFETLSIEQSADVIMATGTNPDALILYLDGLSIDTDNYSVLDVANNEIYIDYGTGPDPIASIRQDLALGYNQGYWNGPAGIRSSSANSNGRFALGYADAADPGNPAGLSSGEIKIMYTLYGDADLNGIVNGTDFSILAAHFGLGATNWDEGDFNYGSSVNGTDFSLLAENFGQGI